MKKRRSWKWAIMLICSIGLLSGCGKEEAAEEKQPETSMTEQIENGESAGKVETEPAEEEIAEEEIPSAELSKTQKAEYGNDEITLLTKTVNDVSVVIPGNEHAEEGINAFFADRNEAWEDTVDLYVEVVENAYDEWAAQEDAGEWKTYEIGREYSVKRADEQMICIVEDTFVYSGGERTNYVRVAYNFDTWTGQRLSLEEAASHLDEIRTESIAYIGELLLEPEYAEILKKDYTSYLEDILTDGTWYTDQEGLHVICNEDLIAPAKEGILEFTLPYDEVDVVDEVYIPETE